ncbi:hypothetical protein [Janthinobacterium sp. FW305-128]|uniref:hypothetical protein n=1 Tax=Janthinobacterium sp. FW305-128 TaxID=2775055 RepID=UPI001E2E77E0|nr:hypothetical protein [Janthinobacterium sp. FW305-128]MCC7684734.1 hypothetical protein [Janthinobacterium sp. FW305-128]
MAAQENTRKTLSIVITHGKFVLQGVIFFSVIVGFVGMLLSERDNLPRLALQSWAALIAALSYNHTIFWLPAALAILFAALALLALGVATEVVGPRWHWWTFFGCAVAMFYMCVFAMNSAIPQCADIFYGAIYGSDCDPYKSVFSDALNLCALVPPVMFVVVFVKLLLGKT